MTLVMTGSSMIWSCRHTADRQSVAAHIACGLARELWHPSPALNDRAAVFLACASGLAIVLARSSRRPALASRTLSPRHRVRSRGITAMSTDALSDVLSAVHLSGSVFFDVTAKSPWVAEAPAAVQIANEITPGAQHVIEYHVVTRGTCW